MTVTNDHSARAGRLGVIADGRSPMHEAARRVERHDEWAGISGEYGMRRAGTIAAQTPWPTIVEGTPDSIATQSAADPSCGRVETYVGVRAAAERFSTRAPYVPSSSI